MKFGIYCLVICVEVFYVTATINGIDVDEACLVEFLKRKGILDNNFRSVKDASPDCPFVMLLSKHALRKSFVDRIEKEVLHRSNCLKSQFNHHDTLDLLIKIHVLQSSKSLDENGVITWSWIGVELDATKIALQQDLENISLYCETDGKSFMMIFDKYLANKNETLAYLQLEYCMAMYAASNKLFDLNKVELNPHHIDTADLNCNIIIEKERNKSDKDLTESIFSLSNGGKIFDCVKDAYRKSKMFDVHIAYQVLFTLDVPKEIKELETVRLNQTLTEFGKSIFTCS